MRVSSLLPTKNIHEFPSISIDFVLAFPQADLDVDTFMDLPLGMGVDVNRGKRVIKLNRSLSELSQ